MTTATLLFALIATVPTVPAGTASGDPVMLDFTASWCGPCRQLRPAVEQLAQKGYPIQAVDVDDNPDLAGKYEVKSVPTFVVVDPSNGRALARREGARDAADLANFYNQAKARFQPARSPAVDDRDRDRDESDGRDDDADAPRPDDAPNPKPWETVVRIKVFGAGAIGFGSGTVISSTHDEAIILTCAHIFKMEGQRQLPPSQFKRRIQVDLFDGVLGGPKKSQVHFNGESHDGWAVDYDFALDVGLIRIRPGRRLPYAKVVPTRWTPKAKMGHLIAVGCPEGQDATAWPTSIINPDLRGLNGNGSYRAIECHTAPIQGRSGGGLFTADGYVAGVCDFAEPTNNRGLYAAPSSIYKMLDRNRLAALYAPERAGDGGALLAGNRPAPASPSPRQAPSIARAQSPDRDESGDATLPPPEMLGVKPPVLADNAPTRVRMTGGDPKTPRWHATPANLKMDPAADPDPYGGAPDTQEVSTTDVDSPTPAAKPAPAPARSRNYTGGKWHSSRTPVPEDGGAVAIGGR